MAMRETTTKLGPGLMAPTINAAMMLMKTPADVMRRSLESCPSESSGDEPRLPRVTDLVRYGR
jgi:hypothetical protein